MLIIMVSVRIFPSLSVSSVINSTRSILSFFQCPLKAPLRRLPIPNVKIPSQRKRLVILWHEDSPQIGVADKLYPEHIIYLALKPVCAAPDRGYGIHL